MSRTAAHTDSSDGDGFAIESSADLEALLDSLIGDEELMEVDKKIERETKIHRQRLFKDL